MTDQQEELSKRGLSEPNSRSSSINDHEEALEEGTGQLIKTKDFPEN